jgi:hypothetical protein
VARRGAATGGLEERWLLYLVTTGSRITMPLINKNNTGGGGAGGKKSRLYDHNYKSYLTLTTHLLGFFFI